MTLASLKTALFLCLNGRKGGDFNGYVYYSDGFCGSISVLLEKQGKVAEQDGTKDKFIKEKGDYYYAEQQF